MEFDSPSTVPTANAIGQYYGGEAKMVRQPNLKNRLELAVQQAEEKLAAVKRAKEIFEKNPDLEELLNIMQYSHF